MATELTRRDGLKLLAAIAGGATAAATQSGDDGSGMLPGGGGGDDDQPVTADLADYRMFHADSFADVSDAPAPALVVISGGSEVGIMEVTK